MINNSLKEIESCSIGVFSFIRQGSNVSARAITSGSSYTASQELGTLPESFRPIMQRRLFIHDDSNSIISSLQIETNGIVKTWLHLQIKTLDFLEIILQKYKNHIFG